MIYLDNAATTRIDNVVLDAMMPWLTDKYGNAGTLYPFGNNAKKAIASAREIVARFMGADSPEQIVFTSGGTESNNASIMNFRLDSGTGTHWSTYIVNPTEHPSMLRSVEASLPVRSGGYIKCKMNQDDGSVDINFIKEQFSRLRNEPLFIAVMQMNNETGAINDVTEIGKLMEGERYSAPLFHVDCVQSAGCVPINVAAINCSTASISSHKIHGPKGVGALYIKEPEYFNPMIIGGKSQEFGLRGGTENVAGIIGFAKACELCMQEEIVGSYATELKKKFWEELKNEFEKAGISDKLEENFGSAERHGKTLNFRIVGLDAETIVLVLGAKGLCVSAGSACKSREQVASYVLTESGMTPDAARESLRVSFSRFNTREECVDAARIIAETAVKLYEYAD